MTSILELFARRLGFGALALAGSWLLAVPAHALTVVATLPSLAALAREVAGPNATVQALLSPRQDAHYADARPNLVLALNRADLLVLNGLGLEVGWLPALAQQARNPKIGLGGPGYFDASRFVLRKNVPVSVDRAQGDIHPGGNPHFAWDPRAGAAIAEALGQTLGQLDPAHAAEYQRNAAALALRLRNVAARETARFAALPTAQRQLVAYHDSLIYLTDWLGLKQVGTVEARPGIPPDPGQLAKVIGVLRSTGARVIAQEEFYPRSTSDQVAKIADAKVVLLPGGARFAEGQKYEDFVVGIANDLLAALSAK